MEDKRKALYDALSGEYDLGSYEDFTTKLNDENKRRALYDAAGQDYNLGSYEEYSEKLGFGSEPSGIVPMFNDEPQGAPMPENVEENSRKLRGLWANFKESSKGLWAGLKGYAGEQLNLFTGSSREEQAALNDIEQLEEQGVDVMQYLADKEDAEFHKSYGMSKDQFLALDKKVRKRLVRQASERMLEQQSVMSDAQLKELKRRQTNQQIVEDAFNNALEIAGGDLTRAKEILREQAADKTKGDILIEEATETMNNLRQPEGFAGWVGNMLPQMVPAAASIAINYLTKGKASGLSKALGYGTMGGLTLSTAGMSMIEARNAGATNLEVWATGIADGAIEIISEKIPFDRVTKRVFSSAKANVAEKLGNAVLTPKGRKELEKLLSDANEKLGGKLFSKKNIGEWLTDTAYEAAGEFTAEALQTITTMIYENPEDYPTISEVLANGWEGAKAGLFMGSITGGASLAASHAMNKDRRQTQGYVDVAQMENENGDVEVVEVVGEDPQTGNVTILHGDTVEEVSQDKLGDRFRFSYDEFENGRLRSREDDAIDNGVVNDGQIRGMEETIQKDLNELRNFFTEDEINQIASGTIPSEASAEGVAAARKYMDDVQRIDDLHAAKAEQDQKRKAAVRDRIESEVGQRFWVQEEGEDDGSGVIPVTETVEEVVYSDGRVGYVVGSDEAGNLTMVYNDGSRGFSSRAEIAEKENSGEILSNTVMGLDDYLAIKVDIEDVTAETTRMEQEQTANVQSVKASHPVGSVINVGTAEAKVEVPVIATTADGVIVQMPDGTTPQLTWADVAHAEGQEVKPKTNAELDQEIVDEYRVAYQPAVKTGQEPSITEREIEVEQTTPANPLPLKADGSVDQTALWNKDPERWAQWNDEQKQDGGANTLAYVSGAIAKEQAKIAELQAAYAAESDFDARDTIEKQIADTQARVERLTAIQQGYVAQAEAVAAPAKSEYAQTELDQSVPVTARQERTTESVLASLTDGTLTDEEIRANIDANLAEAKKSYDKYAKKAPKMGIDKDAYLAEKQKYEQGLPALQQEIDFWNGVKGIYENVMQQEAPPTAESFRLELTEEDINPRTPQELAARELGLMEGGIKLLWDSVKAHTGFGNGERQKFSGIFRSKDKGGMTIEAAGDRLMEMDREYNLGLLDQNDPMAGVNAILDVLGDVQTIGDLRNYIANNREIQVAREADAAYSAMNAEFVATHGMTMEDAAHADHVAMLELMHGKALSEAEQYEINVKFAEEENHYGTDDSSETGAVSRGESGENQSDVARGVDSSYRQSDSILQETQSDITRGETISDGQAEENVSESNEQDGDSSVYAGEQAEEIEDLPDGVSESSLDEDMPDFTNSASAYFPSEETRRKFSAMRARIEDWAQKLGVQVRIMETLDDVVNQSAREQILKGRKVYGYFDPATGEVAFYLPDFLSLHGRELTEKEFLSEIDKTYIHEVVAHRGLRGLLGEEKYGELCDMVWDAMTEQQKAKFLNYPGVNGNTRTAADEYIASFSETINYESNPSAWDKIVALVKDILKSIGLKLDITDNDLASLLRASYQKLMNETQTKVEAEKISLEDYLGRLGLSSPISDYMDDKLRVPHGLTESQRKQLEKEAAAAAGDYQKQRSAAIAEYNRLVSEGKIIPTTQIDKLLAVANGHPNNAATQAARRSLEKRGYDWQTGQKIKTDTNKETAPKASRSVKAPKANDEKIEDFGEKIGGARKDIARAKIRDSAKLSNKDLVELKDPDKILSRKNIIKYYTEGTMTYEDAVKLLAMNMAVRGRDTIDRGVAMKKYRGLALAWESGSDLVVEITDGDVQDRMNEFSERIRQTPDFEAKTRASLELFVLKVYNDYKATYEALEYPEVYRNLKSAYIRYGDHDGKYWVVASPGAYRGWPCPNLEQAVAKMKKIYPEEAAAKKPSESKKDGEKSSSIHVTKDRAGYYRIKSRNIPGEIYLSGKLYSKKDAEEYLAENLDKLVERENRLLEALLGSNIGMVEREGLDYRKGKDVTPKDFLDTFGFRGVEFGNWVPQVERQAYLNKTYDAIMDFCRIVGISPKAFSLGGRLGLAFGSRGKSRALAHYEPMKEVINLTRMKGAGSLAHEWFHALDNYLAKQRSGNTSDMTTDNKPALRQEVTDAFNAFVSAMNRLAYTRRSNRAGQYWGEVWERAARLFESYIYNELGGQNIVSPLLVKKDTLYVDHGEFSDDAWPYPSAEENEQMKPYFDRLFSTLQEQVEEDGSVTLFRAKGAGRKQAQFDIINETNPMTDDYHVGIRKVEDIKTFDEVMEAARRESEEGGWPELASYPDIENSLLEDALETRRIVIYSSHPISNGVFVTPSYMQADEYSGMTGEVFSKEVSVDEVAWINTDEGQYASLDDAKFRYDNTPDNDTRFRATTIRKDVQQEMDVIFAQAIVNGNYLKAPNGADTNLTPEQWLMVRTEGFKFWFGDWEKDPENASKVIDINGEPMVVYHGTQSKFTAFDVGSKGKNFGFRLSDGFYFSPDETVVESYASVPDELKTGEVKAVFLKIINPFHIKSAKDYREQIKEIVSLAARGNRYLADLVAGMSESELLSQRGYDGVVEKRTDELTGEIVVFEPNQIKSATDNTGVFSEYDDIRFRMSNENQTIFVSNAAKAVEGIKMEKATPEQWLKMIEKNGGLKAGEDKWMGLSDFLKSSDKKTLTKQEVLDFVNEHMIVIEEEKYGEVELSALQDEFNEIYDNIIDNVGNEDESNLQLWEVVMNPMEFEQSVLGDFKKEFNLPAPTTVVDVNDRDALAAALGYTPEEFTDEMYNDILAGYEQGGFAFYERDTKRIAIFAREELRNGIMVNNIVFHENTHYLEDENPEILELGEWLWQNSEPELRRKIKEVILESGMYEGEETYEMLAAYTGYVMSQGKADVAYEKTPSELQKHWELIFNAFGYEPRGKEIRRRGTGDNSGRVGSLRDRRDAEAEMPTQQSDIQDLTAEERRIIGEYFPEFNKIEDVRYGMSDVNTNPTEAQKKAGNYKMGHIRLDGYNITIENPKGSVRRGTDSKGNAWENTLNNDYGYIRGTEGVDGDHIDVYLSDNPTEGNVFVIDQVNPETREFDEHKVMYGFDSAEEAREAYLANFSEGWNGLGTITEVSKDEFKKWIESSHRKTKPFSEYKSVRANEMQATDDSELRYRVVSDQETLDRLNSEPTIKVYRAMQLIDGKLYPPMSAKVDGELRQPIELGQWEEAEERPDLVDEKGRFKLDKGNKSSLKARYNPYFHTSPTPLNDQFSSAQTRPELVTVEVEVPESELTSGYKAEKAKDSVGKMEWKAGVIQSKLSGTRTVILSRWDKPVRIVPDSEVADVIVDMFEGKDITMPSNVVTPSLRAELEKRGVPFVETDNQGNPVEEVSFRVTGTPTDEVVANGLQLTSAQTAEVAANIFAALPEESRKKITDGLNGNILGLKDAILQIPTSLASKENWNDEDKQMADVVAEEMTKIAGEMTRPFSAEEGLWLLYNNLNKGTDLISQASRALVQRNLGFDAENLAKQEQAKEDVRFRTVGDATSNAQASLYNRGAVNVWTRLKESFVDMQASVEELVKAIEKKTGKAAQGFENILLALNQQSSKGLAAMESYTQKFLNPMFDEIRRIMDDTKMKYEDIVRYVILKHGLERNKKLAQRDARAHYQEIYDDIIAKIKSMDDRQKRTYLTNAQLKEADAKARLATLQAKDTTSLTDEELKAHKKELANARKEVKEAEEYRERAQKIASLSEQEAQDELDKIFEKIENGTDSVFKEMRENDYSGISSMFYDQLGVDRKNFSTEEQYQAALMEAKKDRYSSLKDIEAAAESEVKSFEGKTDTKELWKRINAATKETLRQQYEANMISKDQYDSLRNMFEYYVPLRGFKDNTAEDMYTYYRKPNSTGYTKPILGAEGRKTEAESPFGWIAAMAGSAIASNVKNEAKLALYYFVSNRPENGIATISRTWFVDSGEVDERGKKIFKPAYPPFSEDLSSDAAKASYEAWQENMRELQKKGQAYEAGQRLNLGNAVVNISDANKPEHIVNVKVGGKDYTIIINGNPRAAQAINGDLNIEGTAQDYSALFGPVLRWMSSVNTSYNPEFWITNMMRDMAFTMMAVNIKEDPAYRRKFSKNYRKAFKVISLAAKNENGTIGDSYLEEQYKDFVKYGGVTGYTQIKDSETWEKEIENYLSSNDPKSVKNGKVMRGMKTAFHAAHRFGESLEQVSRFAAFLTARETGKSINEAINDAKEITVNFNRKGSGKMITLEEAKYLTGKNGQPLSKFQQWMVVGLSSIAPLGRRFIMFFNAAIQGLNATYKLMKKNPKRFTGWALGYAAVGMMNAVLHAMMDDDDYLDIPQYERRNSLMIGGNGAYFKWALPQEARAFYALGDLAVETVMGRNPHQNFLGEALKIGTEILPVNPSEGWKAFMPSVAIPAIELMLNEDYKGAPIYNEQKWLSKEERERTAKWSKAYQGTGWAYVKISQGLNFISGGDKHNAGLINLQPEKLEHLVQSAFGGTIRTADKFISTIAAAVDPEEPVTIRQTPFLNRFLTINDERFKNVHVNDVFDYYKADAEHALTLEKQYTKDRDMDALTKLRSSDEYRWAKIYGKYKKPLKALQDKIKVADGTAEKKELMKQQDELKKRMIKEISEL